MALLYRVGVTGHRAQRLADADAQAVQRTVHEVLRRTRDTARTVAGEGTCTLRLLSSLAEGSDRMVASVALSLGYELHCPLPLATTEFERDFASAESRDAFHALLARASDAFEVQGGGASGGEPGVARVAAYERAGRYITLESDLLVAIWDGHGPRGRGGTGQVVDEAVDRGVPVVWIPLNEPDQVQVRDATGHVREIDAIEDLVRAALRDQLAHE